MECQIDRLGKVSITVDKDYWNINKAYDKLVAVERDGDCAYLSRKPVPAGVLITNREYWIRLGFSSGGGVIAISQNFGYDPGIAISQKAITERFEELENIINELITGGITVDVTFDPSSVTIDTYANVTIYVELNTAVDSIIVLRNNVQIEGEGSGDHHSVTDHIEPTAAPPIKYTIKVTKDGVTKTVYAELPVNKKSANIEWRLNGSVVTDDSVLMGEVGHSYPVLYIPDELDASKIQYVSETPFVASVNNKGVPTPNRAGTTRIHAIYTGDDIYGSKDVYYTLEVYRGNLSAFEWYDPTTGNSIMSDPTWQVNKDASSIVYPRLRVSPAVNVQYTTVPQNSAVATVNSNGVPTLNSAGSVVIRATFDGNDNYNPANAEYTLIVEETPQERNYWNVDNEEKTLWKYTLLNTVPEVKFIPGNGSYTDVKYQIYDYLDRPIWETPKASYNSGNVYEFSISAEGIVRPPSMIRQGTYEFNYRIQALRDGQELANLNVQLSYASWDFDWDFNGTVHEPSSPGGTMQMVTVYAKPWNNTSYIINSGLPSISGTVLVDNISKDSTSDKVVIAKDEFTNDYTVTITDAITSAITVRIKAAKSGDTQHGMTERYYLLRILPPSIPDYYVGYSMGTDAYDNVADGTFEQLTDTAMSEGRNKAQYPSYTRTISAEEACDPDDLLDIQVLYIMWKSGSAPTGGTYDLGLGELTFSASDFLDENQFDIQRDIVDSNGITWHLAGMSGRFYENYYVSVNFN